MRAIPRMPTLNHAGFLWRAALFLGVALAFASWAAPANADFDSGVAAYDRGDFVAAYDEWLPLARGGDPAAQRNIGHLYRRGQGVPQDAAVAVNWYVRAAEAGLARAQANLANMYLRGEGVRRDERAAAVWFQRAALDGHTISQFNLGLMYQQGLGVRTDLTKAMGWFSRAAELGHEKSAETLAALQERGVSPASAEELRTELFGDEATDGQAAISQRPAEGAAAPSDRAARFDENVEVEPGLLAYRSQDYERAMTIWMPLAEKGNSEAQFFVGGLYMDGAGVEEDVVRAHAWWQLSAEKGHPKAQEFRNLIEAIMTEEQREQALQLAPTLSAAR